MTMTNDELNAASDKVADEVKAAIDSGAPADEVRNITFLAVKAAIATAITQPN